MGRNEQGTTLWVKPSTANDINKLKKEMDKESDTRITIDDVLKILIDYYKRIMV